MNLNDMGNKENCKVKIRNYAVLYRKFLGKHKHRSKRWIRGKDYWYNILTTAKLYGCK
jgi:hypothetical protein